MCIYQHGHGVHDGGGQQPQHVRQQQQGGVASVQRGEGLVEVGGVGDGLGDVQLGRDGAEAGLGGHPHVVHQQRVHQIHGRQPHRNVKLEEEAINNLIFKGTKAQMLYLPYHLKCPTVPLEDDWPRHKHGAFLHCDRVPINCQLPTSKFQYFEIIFLCIFNISYLWY